jgi:hypothetical protein
MALSVPGMKKRPLETPKKQKSDDTHTKIGGKSAERRKKTRAGPSGRRSPGVMRSLKRPHRRTRRKTSRLTKSKSANGAQ